METYIASERTGYGDILSDRRTWRLTPLARPKKISKNSKIIFFLFSTLIRREWYIFERCSCKIAGFKRVY